MNARRKVSSIWSWLALSVGVYGALILALFAFQSHLVYYPNLPSRELVATPDRIGLSYESVAITTADGVTLDGWFVAARTEPSSAGRNGARGVVLFFHGNAGNISHRLESLKIFSDLGMETLIFDYRGYGRSQGKPSEAGTYADAEAAWRYLTELRRIPAERIVFFGRSLGAAVAAHLAMRHPPQALILESAFTSVPDLAAELYPFFPVRWLARFAYDTKTYLRSVSCPVLIVHSRDDEIIPFANGQKLYAAAKEPKRFLELQGGHNDAFLRSGRTYVDGLEAFLDAYLDR